MAARKTKRDADATANTAVDDDGAELLDDDAVDLDDEFDDDELDEDDLEADDELDDDDALGDEDEPIEERLDDADLDGEDGETEVVAAPLPPEAEFDDDDDELVAVVTGDDDTDDDADEVDGLRDGEFVCRSCFMAKRETQLADPERLLCRDCA